MAAPTITLLGCGDVGPIHEPVSRFSELVRPVLAQADIRFAQCERVYSERGDLQPGSGGGHSRLAPRLASVFSDCAFDVVSVASNHAMDWGADGLLDTIAVLRDHGIVAIGAGRNLADARAPAFIERNGVRVAFLAYCSVLHEGYAAQADKPGVAPLRARYRFEATDYQPGVPPQTITEPYAEDVAGMVEDIAAAKLAAHVVVVSMHWGVHFVPKLIADYQPQVARAAFKAGADLILGHHAHLPKAVAVLEGKTCYYSLSNFMMSAPAHTPEKAAQFSQRYGVLLDPDYPNLPYGTDGKRSLIAKAVLSHDGVRRTSFLPVLIDKSLRPEVLRAADPRFDEAVAYMRSVSEGVEHAYTVQGDEVVVAAP